MTEHPKPDPLDNIDLTTVQGRTAALKMLIPATREMTDSMSELATTVKDHSVGKRRQNKIIAAVVVLVVAIAVLVGLQYGTSRVEAKNSKAVAENSKQIAELQAKFGREYCRLINMFLKFSDRSIANSPPDQRESVARAYAELWESHDILGCPPPI